MKINTKPLKRFALGLSLLAGSTIASAAEEHSAAEVGKKLADPLSDIWALFTEVDYTWSEGKLTDGKWRSGQAVIFQPIMPINLSENWKLITRPTVPVIAQQDVPDGFRCNFDNLPPQQLSPH